MEDEANQQDADKGAETEGDQDASSPDGVTPAPGTPGDPKSGKASADPTAPEGEEGEEKEEPEKHPYQIMDIIDNDHLDKAALSPPLDPEGESTLVPDLIVKQDKMIDILTGGLQIVLEWLVAEKQKYFQMCVEEGKVLQDQSVEELDENLRK